MAVDITNSNNTVSVSTTENSITVTNTDNNTSVNVSAAEVSTVTISAKGPQGQKGDPGENRLNVLGTTVLAGDITGSGGLQIAEINVSRDVTVGGTVTAEGFISTAGEEGIDFNDSIDIQGNITASGFISASSGVITPNITSSNILLGSSIIHEGDPDTFIAFGNNTMKISAGGRPVFTTLTSGDKRTLSASADFVSSNITSSGNISSSGTIVASNLSGTNTGDQDLSSYALISQISGAFNSSSNEFDNRIDSLENKTLISSSAQFTLTDDVKFRNITASNDISASGNIIGLNGTFTNVRVPNFNSAGVVFVGASGIITEDVSNFYYNNGTDTLYVAKLNSTYISSSGAITASAVSSSGIVVGSNLSGTNTGDQDLSSYALISQISGAFGADSSSLSSSIAALETSNTGDQDLSPYALISQISGAFGTDSSSLSSSIATLETNNTGINTGDQDLSSYALISQISGAFGADSSSLSSSIATLETNNTGTNTGDQDLSTYALISQISGSWQGQNFISGSQVVDNLPAGIYSSSLQVLTNITASGNISASGEIIGATGSFNIIEGGTF